MGKGSAWLLSENKQSRLQPAAQVRRSASPSNGEAVRLTGKGSCAAQNQAGSLDGAAGGRDGVTGGAPPFTDPRGRGLTPRADGGSQLGSRHPCDAGTGAGGSAPQDAPAGLGCALHAGPKPGAATGISVRGSQKGT